jgi:hypothetical protein
MNSLEELGWDEVVEECSRIISRQNFWVKLYWYAYNYCTNGDADAGVCFTLREDAIKHILEQVPKTLKACGYKE